MRKAMGSADETVDQTDYYEVGARGDFVAAPGTYG
jgi:hypothetical protein